MAFEDSRVYGGPADGSAASIGASTQINPIWFWKKALVEIVKEQHFGQLADVRSMPKHMGKTIKQHHYLPLLDDRNVSDQGIDAAGTALGVTGKWHAFSGGVIVSDATITGNAAGFTTKALAVAAVGFVPATMGAVLGSGALYSSTKDIGSIVSRLPALSESGGRVNRVGFTRKTIEATIEKFGFFDEYTQESMDFDTDADLMMHISRESMRGANEITEDMLQIDLINAAGNSWFTGDATTIATVGAAAETAQNAVDCLVTYDDLVRMAIELDNNRCPKHTKIISGSRMIDTKTINAARYLYVGSVLLPLLKQMKDYHGEKAFISVEKYANAANVAFGEVGTIDNFRIIVVNEMVEWEGDGYAVATPGNTDVIDTTTAGTPGFGLPIGSTLANNGVNYNVYPMLVVGSGSFTTIGFQTDGKSMKFKIHHKAPGLEMADRNDPYGEIGFYSIKWYYAFMGLRPEWITVAYTGAVA